MSDETLFVSSPEEKDNLILRRRKFIRSALHTFGKITELEVKEWLKDKGQEFSLKALKNDISFIQNFEDINIFQQRNPREKYLEWVNDSRKLGATREDRLQYKLEEKKKISELALSIILGFRKFEIAPGVNQKTIPIENLNKILGLLPQLFSDATKCELFIEKLKDFWSDGQRSLFLDSGTTGQLLSQSYLQFLRLPMSGIEAGGTADLIERPVNKIEVITNDRHIFHCLGDPSVSVKTIMIGGRQQFRSSSVSGMMAERFLEVNAITAGAALIGTTGITLGKKSYFCAENEHLAAIKLQFIKRSKLRIIIADKSKFEAQSSHADTYICSLNNNEIDLVITDDADNEVVEHFKKHNVPLISYKSVDKIITYQI